MEDKKRSASTLRVSVETLHAVREVCTEATCNQDTAVAAGIAMLQTRGLAGNGLVRLELVRAIDTLESTAFLLAATNLQLADCCAALVEGRLANIDRGLEDLQAAAKGVRHG